MSNKLVEQSVKFSSLCNVGQQFYILLAEDVDQGWVYVQVIDLWLYEEWIKMSLCLDFVE